MHLGDRIRFLLSHRGWSQRQLADAIGHSAPWVSDFLKKSELQTDLVRKVAAALQIEPGILLIEDDDAFRDAALTPSTSERRTGLVKSVTLETVYKAGDVTGADVLMKVPPDSPYAGLRKALKLSHLHRAGKPDYRTVELAGVPSGVILIDCRTPLEVRVEGQVRQLHPAGTILVADPERRPEPEDLVLTLYAPEPDGVDLEKSVSFAQIRRFERGPRGIGLLFSLDKDEAAVEGGDWQVVATVVDFRFVRP